MYTPPALEVYDKYIEHINKPKDEEAEEEEEPEPEPEEEEGGAPKQPKPKPDLAEIIAGQCEYNAYKARHIINLGVLLSISLSLSLSFSLSLFHTHTHMPWRVLETIDVLRKEFLELCNAFYVTTFNESRPE